jgi:hypothetical protein
LAYDDVDWTRNSGGTPSSETGPSSAQEGSFYIYTETSNPDGLTGQEYIVEGPEIDADIYEINLTFWYHMYLNNTNPNSDTVFALDINDSTGWNNNIWSKTGGQGDLWRNETVDLSSFNGTITPRFRVTIGSTGSID